MKIKYYFLSALAACVLVSCGDKMDYKEFKIDDAEYMKKKFERAGGLITSMYSRLDSDFGNYSNAMLSSATDESVFSTAGNAVESFYNGAWGPTNANSSIWTSCYQGINYCNLFLNEFNNLTFDEYKMDLDYKAEIHQYNNFQFEARFLRAYFYFLLVRQYGDVPFFTSSLDAATTNTLPRTSAEDIFKFIDDECVAIKDTIIKDYTDLGKMALTVSENGRANNLAVLALRARAALYHASPLFNPDNNQELWKKAAQANLDVINACKSRGMALSTDYAGLFLEGSYKDSKALKELIFGNRLYSLNINFETNNFPVGMSGAGAGGKGGNCPSYNLYEAYEAGDVRLAATIAKNGDAWPNVNTQELQTYRGGANGLPIANATPTGFYLKKYVNGGTQISGSSVSTRNDRTWVIFRLAEFYLNYAEAYLNLSDKSGFTMTAANAINTVRNRAGLGNLSDGEATLDACKKERFVEFAFEGQRFFDVRRWKEGSKYFQNIYGLEITKNADGSFTETKKLVGAGLLPNARDWQEKMNLFPIPQSEIMKNPNLTQNPGW